MLSSYMETFWRCHLRKALSHIYTGGVLEHFRNTQKAVNEIYRCLIHGGFTTNTVPYLSFSAFYRWLRWGNIPDIYLLRNLLEFIEIRLFKGKRMRFGYEKSFSEKKIRDIFKKAGFKEVEIGLFKTYYTLDWINSNFEFLRNTISKFVNASRLFWPMIYISALKP